MRIKTRPGVVLAPICGEYLLVSAKALRDLCPYVTQINETSAFLWQQLIGGATRDELLRAVMREYEIDDPAEVSAAIDSFLNQMFEAGYLLEEKEGTDHEE